MTSIWLLHDFCVMSMQIKYLWLARVLEKPLNFGRPKILQPLLIATQQEIHR